MSAPSHQKTTAGRGSLVRVLYHPELVQEVVFTEINKREGTELYEEYYRLANEIYEGEDEFNRGARFKRLDADFFRRLGLHEVMNDVLKEFPEFEGKLKTIHIQKTRTLPEAGSDLDRDNQEAFLKLFAEDFEEVSRLRRILRHELMHLADMLDEGFGYKDGRLTPFTLQENVVKDRYRVLWDIFIDSRLERLKKEAPCSKEERFQEFQALFRSVAPGKERVMFEGLWGEQTPFSHDRLREMATEPTLVAAYAGAERAEVKGPLPGSPCPVCKFPTHRWVEGSGIRQEVVELVRQDLPQWGPGQGICETCHEYYLNRAGLWF